MTCVVDCLYRARVRILIVAGAGTVGLAATPTRAAMRLRTTPRTVMRCEASPKRTKAATIGTRVLGRWRRPPRQVVALLEEQMSSVS